MQLLSFAIAAGETKVFEIAGRYLEVIDSAAPLDIYLSDTAGGRTDDARGALSGLFMEGAFARFEIYSATAQNIELLITEGRGGSRRQPGIVRIVDQGAEKTVASSQFFGTLRISADATKVLILGLQATTKRLVIKRINIESQTAGLFSMYYATGAPTDTPIAIPVSNKLVGGAVGTALRVTGKCATSSASGVELPGGNRERFIRLNVNEPREIMLTTPMVLEPGGVVAFVGPAVNIDMSMEADLEEQA